MSLLLFDQSRGGPRHKAGVTVAVRPELVPGAGVDLQDDMLCKHNIPLLRVAALAVIHNRIALFRAERNMSRRALAEAVGVNPQTIGYLERGDYAPSLELGMKIAGVFELPVEALFSFEPFEPVWRAMQRAERGE